jgi:hypothetical protein
MRTRYGIAVIAAAGLGLLASTVSAQVTDPNALEAKCEQSTGKALTKFVGAKAKCSAKCIGTQRKVGGPYGGCLPSSGFSDPTTNACLFDPLKGAGPKARAAIVKACGSATSDCPECYTAQDPGLCTSGDPLVSDAESNTNLFGPLVYCKENGGVTPTAVEAKCEDTVGKALVKFVGAKSKCYTKCNQAILKGTIPMGSCDPPSPTDAATQACIFDPLKGAEAKAAAAINKACADVGGNPSCYGTGLDTGQEWVNAVEAQVDNTIPDVACGA